MVQVEKYMNHKHTQTHFNYLIVMLNTTRWNNTDHLQKQSFLNLVHVCMCPSACVRSVTGIKRNCGVRLLPPARKDGRYRDPPPTPPGYTALTITDVTEGTAHSGRRPPDYTTALQRSRLVTHSPDSQQPPAAGKPIHSPDPRGREEEEAEEVEEEGECLSPKLRAQRRRGPHTAVPPRP